MYYILLDYTDILLVSLENLICLEVGEKAIDESFLLAIMAVRI